jgi:hypothetical protein
METLTLTAQPLTRDGNPYPAMDAQNVRFVRAEDGRTWVNIEWLEWHVMETGTIAAITFTDGPKPGVTLETNTCVHLGGDLYFTPGDITVTFA